MEELDGRVVSALGVRSRKLSTGTQWPVMGWVTKIYYLEFLRALEGTLSRWSRLYLQSLYQLQFQGELTSGRRPVVKIIAKYLSQHDKRHVVPTPLSVG
jgi:hypothetical protein